MVVMPIASPPDKQKPDKQKPDKNDPGNENPVSTVCSQCGLLKKTGKLSCCVKGGSWQKKCGNDGSKSEHTWAEGFEACKNMGKLMMFECNVYTGI